MKCPNDIRVCPNGWSDCSYCANLKACNTGTYVAELEDHELTKDLGIIINETFPVVQAIPEIVEPRFRGTWAEQFSKMSLNDRMKEFYRYHPTDLHYKEPIPLDGPRAPGGSKSGKNRNKKKGTKKFTNVWLGL